MADNQDCNANKQIVSPIINQAFNLSCTTNIYCALTKDSDPLERELKNTQLPRSNLIICDIVSALNDWMSKSCISL